jgi:hypothetical protein
MTKRYRQGAVGALFDEYERACGELARIVSPLADDEYAVIRDEETSDEDCRSIATILAHVVRAGYGYAGLYRDAWGSERTAPEPGPVARKDVPMALGAMLDYTAATLEGRWALPEEEGAAMRIQARWGPVYDFEQLFEHAIVHVLRHRRQVERFLAS